MKFKKIISTILAVAMISVTVLFLCCPTVKAVQTGCHHPGGVTLVDGSMINHVGCTSVGSIANQLWSMIPEMMRLLLTLVVVAFLAVVLKELLKWLKQRKNFSYLYYKFYARGFVPLAQMRITSYLVLLQRGTAALV